MMRFWRFLDQLGRLEAVRASWQKELGGEFAECLPLLRASDVVYSIEDEEIADRSNENSPFTCQDDIDPVEMAGSSIRHTSLHSVRILKN